MTTLREAAEMALGALEYGHFAVADQAPHSGVMAYLEATDSLRTALAAQDKQDETRDNLDRYTQEVRNIMARKPLMDESIGEVAIQDTQYHGYAMAIKPHIQVALEEGTKLYTTPPQRKPLTEEEMRALWESHGYKSALCMRFARAIERAHGIEGEKE